MMDLYTLAVDGDDRCYLVHGDQALGPVPVPSGQEGGMYPPEAFAHEDLAALGLTWEPLPRPWYPEDEDGITPMGNWYVHQDGPGGGRYVERTSGYLRALRAFLASEAGRAWCARPPATQRCHVPYVTCYPDGRYEVGTDAASVPLTLPFAPRTDLAEQLADDLRVALQKVTWQSTCE